MERLGNRSAGVWILRYEGDGIIHDKWLQDHRDLQEEQGLP